jgi:uncharacterized protein with NAD-binding domain and iron-sulfur cluster
VSSRRRVVILGGGIAALAAAWELSAPGHRDEIESITVYQRGWRLGGKGASSRGVHGRIEEHGLHVWLGYYENAFRLVRECYAELDRPRTDPTSPIPRWDDAFRPASTIGLGELHDGDWRHWVAHFAENGQRPGEPDADARPMTAAELLWRAVRLLADFGGSLVDDESLVRPRRVVLSVSETPPVRPSGARSRTIGALTADAMLVAALASLSALDTVNSLVGDVRDRSSSVVLDAVDVVVSRLQSRFANRVRAQDGARRTWQFLDLLQTIVRGLVVDRILDDPDGYAAVDDEDYREWLIRHGAAAETIASPLVRVVYDLVFGYESGDDHRPRFAAGTGLLLSGKMFFDYRGAIFWKMTAGMGEVVFAPLYQALRARGVEFRYFHRVDALRVDARGDSIDRIELGIQARLADHVDDYEPLIDVDGLQCWPAEPRSEQLETTERREAGDFESLWCATPDAGSVTLRAGVDYDTIVLAIPVGMHPYICADLIANAHTPQWSAMSEHLGTVATQTMQLWLRVDESTLGWHSPNVTTSGYPGAFHTYASMSRLLAAEHWPADRAPRSIAYFCHVFPTGEIPPRDDAGYPQREHQRVIAGAAEFLRHDVARIWPESQREGDFRWDWLEDQYVRANVDPSDRYVLSLPGTGRFRLRADESGYDNLFLAGDWIDSGLNAGCIEAAVVAGIQAANAVLRRPLLERVAGFYLSHVRARWRETGATNVVRP